MDEATQVPASGPDVVALRAEVARLADENETLRLALAGCRAAVEFGSRAAVGIEVAS